MRIVMLYNTCWYVFLLRRNLISALQQHGCHVTVIAPYDQYTERVKALGVAHVPISMSGRGTNPLSEARTVASVLGALRSTRPDAVLSYTIKCNLYAGLCKSIVNFKQIANISGLGEGFDHPGPLSSLVRNLYRIALRNTDQVFFQNPEDLALCARNKLVNDAQSRLLPGSGVDLSLFQAGTAVNHERRIFLMFGRLLPKKGFHAFIDSARTLKSRFGQRMTFQILGAPDPERPESLELLSTIQSAHTEGIIQYLQPTDDVLPILRSADVVVLPSTYNEGVPRSLLEALACGKPIVTTDWKGCRETVIHAKNGLLVNPATLHEGLTDALTKMGDISQEDLLAMGRASRAHAEQYFDEQIVIREYLRALGLDSRDFVRPAVTERESLYGSGQQQSAP